MAKDGRATGRSIFDVLLVLEAALFLILTRLALFALPFRRISPFLGVHLQTSSEQLSSRTEWCARRVGRGIHFAFLRLPWHSTCLVQAIAAMMMLRRRGEASTLYIGVGRENETFGAHAWLRSGQFIVTGGDEKDKFKVLSSFMQPGRQESIPDTEADV
ncbi:MAG: lasso peptide biosynthesis B2 protein [Candidatus Latescibacteria bacterium]|jgi:hypothetical protein|nr:lasso peptide biosynthesis B2 protein [Candidatus Latescibacterota bacterium]